MKQLIKLQPRINQPVSEFELILHVSNKITTICLNYNSVMIQYDSIMHTYMWIHVHNSKKKKNSAGCLTCLNIHYVMH